MRDNINLGLWFTKCANSNCCLKTWKSLCEIGLKQYLKNHHGHGRRVIFGNPSLTFSLFPCKPRFLPRTVQSSSQSKITQHTLVKRENLHKWTSRYPKYCLFINRHWNLLCSQKKVWRLLICSAFVVSLVSCIPILFNPELSRTYLLCVGREEQFRWAFFSATDDTFYLPQL